MWAGNAFPGVYLCQILLESWQQSFQRRPYLEAVFQAALCEITKDVLVDVMISSLLFLLGHGLNILSVWKFTHPSGPFLMSVRTDSRIWDTFINFSRTGAGNRAVPHHPLQDCPNHLDNAIIEYILSGLIIHSAHRQSLVHGWAERRQHRGSVFMPTHCQYTVAKWVQRWGVWIYLTTPSSFLYSRDTAIWKYESCSVLYWFCSQVRIRI